MTATVVRYVDGPLEGEYVRTDCLTIQALCCESADGRLVPMGHVAGTSTLAVVVYAVDRAKGEARLVRPPKYRATRFERFMRNLGWRRV